MAGEFEQALKSRMMPMPTPGAVGQALRSVGPGFSVVGAQPLPQLQPGQLPAFGPNANLLTAPQQNSAPPPDVVTAPIPSSDPRFTGPSPEAAGRTLYTTPDGYQAAYTDAEVAKMQRPAPGGGGPGGPSEAQKTALGWLDRERDILQAEQRAGQEALVLEKARVHAQAEELTNHEKISQDARAQREQEIQARLGDYDKTAKELSNFKIDPGREFRDRSTVGQLFTAISLIVGGATARSTGGRNMAAETLDKMIDRDIDAQKAEYGAKREGLAGKQNMYAMAVAKYGRGEQADAVTKAGILDRYAQQAQMLAAQGKSEAMAAGADRLQLEIDKKRWAILHPAAVGGGGAPQTAGTIKVDDKGLISMGDGMFVEGTPEQAAKIQARRAYENQIGVLQDQAEAIIREHGRKAFVPGTEGYRQMEIVREQAIPIISLGTQQGIVHKEERDPTLKAQGLGGTVVDAAASKLGVSSWDPMKNLQSARKTLRSGTDAMLKEVGGPVVREQFVTDRKGQVVRQFQFAGQGGQFVQALQQPKPQAPQGAPSFFKPVK